MSYTRYDRMIESFALGLLIAVFINTLPVTQTLSDDEICRIEEVVQAAMQNYPPEVVIRFDPLYLDSIQARYPEAFVYAPNIAADQILFSDLEASALVTMDGDTTLRIFPSTPKSPR